ncbi:MAG: ATPase, T2SS/T4P/T4SS family [Planctomycetota bacterium]
MPDLLLTAVEYGGYLSPVKLVIFLALFLAWLPLVTWVYNDAKAVQVRQVFWTSVVFAAGALATIIWLLTPFAVGIIFYLIAVAAVSLSYVRHRNAKVMEYDRILTVDHIKSLLAGRKDKVDALKSFVFITANNNEVPIPQPKTPDFFGYKAAHQFLSDAIWRRASDVVFSPTHQDYKAAYQIDGATLKQPSVPKEQVEYFIRFVKNLADLDVNEKRKPQKGKFKVRQREKNTEWEVATAGSTAGEQLLLRQLAQVTITRLADIGLAPDQYEMLDGIRQAKQGLFIVSGPKRSGVSTTFYTLLRNHDAFINSINTLEREPSDQLPNITQNVFSLSDTGTTTFDERLQTIVRMGPDIVGVAGCQDTETAQTACKAAIDAKIVYLTLKADSVAKALLTWIKLVGDKDLALDAILAVTNQRLLRILCSECKQAYTPNKELLRKFSIPAEKAKVLYRAGKVQYDKHGKPTACEHCQGTGFVGRTGVFEIITMSNQLRTALKQSKSLSDITSLLRGAKMLYLQEHALRSLVDGTTAVNEIIRAFSESRRTPKTG